MLHFGPFLYLDEVIRELILFLNRVNGPVQEAVVCKESAQGIWLYHKWRVSDVQEE